MNQSQTHRNQVFVLDGWFQGPLSRLGVNSYHHKAMGGPINWSLSLFFSLGNVRGAFGVATDSSICGFQIAKEIVRGWRPREVEDAVGGHFCFWWGPCAHLNGSNLQSQQFNSAPFVLVIHPPQFWFLSHHQFSHSLASRHNIINSKTQRFEKKKENFQLTWWWCN